MININGFGLLEKIEKESPRKRGIKLDVHCWQTNDAATSARFVVVSNTHGVGALDEIEVDV